MLLAIDIGNTNTVIGVFEGETLVNHWRIATSSDRTADENAIVLRQLFELGANPLSVDAGIVASVVPNAQSAMLRALSKHFGVEAFVVGPGLRSGMPILYENPKEVGADRIVNAVAAFEARGEGLIVVDFGTATTFDCISPQGDYLGGAIAPGVTISADALYRHAAKLPRVAISRPPGGVVGRNTIASMQAGLYFGYAGLVDGIVSQMLSELDFEARVIATGGLAELIASASKTIERADPLLTLRGLRLLYARNA